MSTTSRAARWLLFMVFVPVAGVFALVSVLTDHHVLLHILGAVWLAAYYLLAAARSSAHFGRQVSRERRGIAAGRRLETGDGFMRKVMRVARVSVWLVAAPVVGVLLVLRGAEGHGIPAVGFLGDALFAVTLGTVLVVIPLLMLLSMLRDEAGPDE